jgi:HEAT repeat protein
MRRTAVLLIAALVSSAFAEEPPPPERLLRGLGARSYHTRREAVLACEGRNESVLLERLLVMARSDPHPNIRGFVARALATWKDERVFGLLAEMARSEGVGPRANACVALGTRGDIRALPVLLAALEDRNARGYAAKALGLLGDPRGFEPVERCLRAHHGDAYVGELAPFALLALDARKGRAVLLDVFPAVGAGARWSLVRALGKARDPVVAEAMLGHLGSSDDSLRRSAIELAGLTGGAGTARRLVRHLEEAPGDRASAAKALGDLADRAAVKPLIALLGASEEPGVRAACARSLGQIGDRAAVFPIVRAMRKETDPLAANVLIEALAALRDERAISDLVAMLDSRLVCRQPRTISSIWVFPWNATAARTAHWAILTIRDGNPPSDLDQVSGFPTPPPPDTEALARLRAWWRNNREDARYRLPDQRK